MQFSKPGTNIRAYLFPSGKRGCRVRVELGPQGLIKMKRLKVGKYEQKKKFPFIIWLSLPEQKISHMRLIYWWSVWQRMYGGEYGIACTIILNIWYSSIPYTGCTFPVNQNPLISYLLVPPLEFFEKYYFKRKKTTQIISLSS